MYLSCEAGFVTQAGRGLQPRPKRFNTAANFESCEKLYERGNIPRPAFVTSKATRKACPQTLWQIVARKLDQLDSVQSLEELKVPPGNRLRKPLRG